MTPPLTPTTPLARWNEATVSRFVRAYRHGRVAQSTVALLGPLCTGKGLARRYRTLHDDDLT